METKFFPIAALAGLLWFACGGGKQTMQTDTASDVTTVSESPCPDWFTSPPEVPDYLFAAATATSRDLQMAVNKAKQQARVDIGSQVEIHLRALNKQFQEEIGLGEDSEFATQATVVVKEVVSSTLRGAKAKYQTTKLEGAVWRACVLMEYPLGEANAQFVSALKKRDILRQRLAASEAFNELDKETEKLEQKKVSEKNQ